MGAHEGRVLPAFRRLRVYSHDPAAARRIDSFWHSEIAIDIPWEPLGRGPIGDYVGVIDADPPSNCFYPPVDLEEPGIIATDGLAPSEANPQAHQQMVYAVAMATIGHFVRALGRPVMWSDRLNRNENGAVTSAQFVRRLRLYPHAIRDRNAYYSKDKKAVLFGYFPNELRDRNNTPGTIVFTCTSHDIIAHEVTHAILDGAKPYFAEQTNCDVLAFHEGFADLIALFQHFSYPGVLASQIAKTKGDLERDSFLGKLAQEFGQASGRGDALRSYLGEEKDGKWRNTPPDPRILETTFEPHDRGAVLVAAVFGAFVKIYRARSRDLFRLASGGTGVLRPGDIHPDLVARLASEAAETADHMLRLCIRAIDYCPPANITFGDYLRALITADFDADAADSRGYRVALIESFREWGIFPRGVTSMSVETLLWPTARQAIHEAMTEHPTNNAAPSKIRKDSDAVFDKLSSILVEMFGGYPYNAAIKEKDSRGIKTSTEVPSRAQEAPDGDSAIAPSKLPGDDRFAIWQGEGEQARRIWNWLYFESETLDDGAVEILSRALGFRIKPDADAPQRLSIRRARIAEEGPEPSGLYRIQIGSVRTALRANGRLRPQIDLVVEIIQTREGYYDEKAQSDADEGKKPAGRKPDFKYRAGCTLIIDTIANEVRRVIRTAGRVDDEREFARLRDFLLNDDSTMSSAFAGTGEALGSGEPFALVHRHKLDEDHGKKT